MPSDSELPQPSTRIGRVGRVGLTLGPVFTDFVFWNPTLNVFTSLKIASTPHDPKQAILLGLSKIRTLPNLNLNHPVEIVLATDLADRLLTAKPSSENLQAHHQPQRIAWLTTAGFRDGLTLGRTHPAAPVLEPAAGLASVIDCYEVPERLDAQGKVLHEPTHQDLAPVAEQLLRRGYHRIAVCFLHAYANPRHEQLVRQMLLESFRRNLVENPPQIILSHEILPRCDEFTRAWTTLQHTLLAPPLQEFADELSEALQLESPASPPKRSRSLPEVRRLDWLGGDGHLLPQPTGVIAPLRTLRSTTAAGLLAARQMATQAGLGAILTLEVGVEQSTISLLLDTPHLEFCPDPLSAIERLKFTSLPLATSTLVKMGTVGELQLGPEQAGADPGPLCLGKGTRPTLTDAWMVLGRLNKLTEAQASTSLETLPHLSLAGLAELARGHRPEVIAAQSAELAETRLALALQALCLQHRRSPAELTLVAYGDQTGACAAGVAQKAGITRLLLPQSGAVLAAWGCLMATPSHFFSWPIEAKLTEVSFEFLKATADRLKAILKQELAPLAHPHESQLPTQQVWLECAVTEHHHIRGSLKPLNVPLDPDFAAHLRTLYHLELGKHLPLADSDIEILNLHVRLSHKPKSDPLVLQPIEREQRAPQSSGETPLILTHPNRPFSKTTCPIYDRNTLAAGSNLQGPALIVDAHASVYVPPETLAHVDPYGHVMLNLRTPRSGVRDRL